LKLAARDRLVVANVATEAEHPQVKKSDAARSCWWAAEAKAVLAAADAASPQMAAFVALAVDTGARKSELAGLLWSDVDLDAETVSITKQLDTALAGQATNHTKRAATRLDEDGRNRRKAE
jgi:integrase